MNSEYLEKLARLAVYKGVNLQPDQILVVNTHVEAVDLTRLVVEEAYKAGAKEVIVRYSDPICSHETYLHADPERIVNPPKWQVEYLNTLAKEGAAFLHILGDDPTLMADVDPQLLTKKAVNTRTLAYVYRDHLDNMIIPWSIICNPSRSWAAQVYPELSEEEALETLWQDVFAMTRIDENDPLENWDQHLKSFSSRVEKLNALKLKTLHYKNSLGTDFTVGMPKGYIFMGGGSQLQNGLVTLPNIPTEEIFSAPHRLSANGRLVASKPLVYNGNKIEGLWFDFKKGRVVEFGADEGAEVVESILNTDDGAHYLGEIALVPWDSPISALNRIYYDTLIDENAACHFALGMSYMDTIKDGLKMDEKTLRAKGMNQSKTHVDFMVGTEDLSITGTCEDGREIVIFENGKFAPWFD